jgi:hypothetical protein
MAKKKITPPQQAQAFTSDRLPTLEQINETLELIKPTGYQTAPEATSQAGKKTFKRIDPKNVKKPEDGRTIKGRVKFTTMLHPGLRAQLTAVAMTQQVSVADVLDTIIREYFDLTPDQVAKMTPPVNSQK